MKNKKMKGLVLFGPRDLRFQKYDIPVPKPDEALVRIKSVGICGSDIHIYQDGRIGPYIIKEPLILGHECSGEIIEVGSNVRNLRVGDKVIFEPGYPCGKCWYCRHGKYNNCKNVTFMATPPYNGSMVEFMTWPANYLYKMPKDMSFQEGALIEPFCVGLQSARRADFNFGANLVILGSGPIGLMILEAVKTLGAGEIIVVDVIPNRLEMAKKMGADYVINAKENDVEKKVKELTSGEGVNFVFEAAGTAKTFNQSVYLARQGGKVILTGIIQENNIPMPMGTIIFRDIDIIPIFRYYNVFEEAINLVAHKRANILPIKTHEYPFEKALEAFETAEKNKEEALKVIINI